MYSLGLSTMGNSAACLFKDGVLVAAVEEERLSRIKNDGAFPMLAVGECLRIAGITLADVGNIYVYWQPWRLSHRLARTARKSFGSWPAAKAMGRRCADMFLPTEPDPDRPEDTGSWGALFQVKKKLTSAFGASDCKVHFVDHHQSHQAYAEAMRDWDDYISLSYDGGGESLSTVLTLVTGSTRTQLPPHYWPNSLGHFYSFFTGYLGFKMLEGEYKMMGLAPYGSPVYKDALLKHCLTLEPNGRYRLNTKLCDYHLALRGTFSEALTPLLCAPRARDAQPTQDQINLAASVQAVFEEALKHIIAAAKAEAPQLRKAVLSGGCALNVTANGRLLQSGLVDQIIVPPAPDDSGCCIGAVLTRMKSPDLSVVRSPYQGAAYSHAEIQAAAKEQGIDLPAPLHQEEMLAQTVGLLSDGKIIAWFQGRSEFGPRALGARSFLADPRRDTIREDINRKIKKRELFRPFAPSVTEEAATQFFELDQDSPYMNILARVRDEMADQIPAVTHTDQTARVHTVSATANPLYHALLSGFGAATGVPVLLNTSFNIQEPIVYSPAHAFATFRNSGVDALVIGNTILRREDLP